MTWINKYFISEKDLKVYKVDISEQHSLVQKFSLKYSKEKPIYILFFNLLRAAYFILKRYRSAELDIR